MRIAQASPQDFVYQRVHRQFRGRVPRRANQDATSSNAQNNHHRTWHAYPVEVLGQWLPEALPQHKVTVADVEVRVHD